MKPVTDSHGVAALFTAHTQDWEGQLMSEGHSFQTPASGTPHYRALLLDSEGNLVRIEDLFASDDDEAIELGRALADGHGVDVWAGVRFLEHFDSRAASI